MSARTYRVAAQLSIADFDLIIDALVAQRERFGDRRPTDRASLDRICRLLWLQQRGLRRLEATPGWRQSPLPLDVLEIAL